MQDITKECGKIGLLLGIGGTHEDLISWIVCIPAGDCGAESIVRVRESCGGCDSVEHGLGEKRAWGGRKSILDGREEEYGSERSGVASHRGSVGSFSFVVVLWFMKTSLQFFKSLTVLYVW